MSLEGVPVAYFSGGGSCIFCGIFFTMLLKFVKVFLPKPRAIIA